MGLGPPVCQHCQVLGHLSTELGWYCKYCGETDLTDFFPFSLGIRSPEYRELENNEKFYKFVNGEDPNAPTST
jgi:hypothetical protein